MLLFGTRSLLGGHFHEHEIEKLEAEMSVDHFWQEAAQRNQDNLDRVAKNPSVEEIWKTIEAEKSNGFIQESTKFTVRAKKKFKPPPKENIFLRPCCPCGLDGLGSESELMLLLLCVFESYNRFAFFNFATFCFLATL